mgnify:CR=1 FL=1
MCIRDRLYVSGTSGTGIGEARLDVHAHGNIDARSMLANYYRFTTTDGSNGVYVGLGSSATTGSVTVGYPGAAGETRMTFKTSNNATGETDRMTLDHDGNFGIGTTTPTKTLDVVGNISASQEVSASLFCGDGSGLSNITAATASNADKIDVVENPAGSADFRVAFVDNIGSGYEQVYVDTGLVYNPNTEIFKVTDVEVTNAITASGIHSGPLHIHGSSVHSGTIDMYAGGGLYFFGEDGSQSGSLTNTPGGLLLTPDAAGRISVNGNAEITGSLIIRDHL